jgi:hypothetical protein
MSHRKSDLGIPCPRKICQSSARQRDQKRCRAGDPLVRIVSPHPLAATVGARSFKRHLRGPTIRRVLRARAITEAHNGVRGKNIGDCCPPETLRARDRRGALGWGDAGRLRQRARLTSEQLTTVDLLLPPVCSRTRACPRRRVVHSRSPSVSAKTKLLLSLPVSSPMKGSSVFSPPMWRACMSQSLIRNLT